MEKPFEDEAIRRATYHLGKDKAPGLDRFTIEFFKVHWEIVKTDFIKVFGEFYLNGSICKSMNFYFHYPRSKRISL